MSAYVDATGVTQLTADIKELADATYPANEAVAPEYDATSAYEIGDYCIHSGMLYKCNTAIATGGEAWNATHWAKVSVSEELGNGGAVESVNGKTGVVVLDANDVSAVPTSDFDSFRGAFKAFTVTLASGSWSSKAQTVSNANFLATGYAYLVYPQGSHMAIYSEDIVYADNVTTDGQMTFHCTTVPTSNLTVNIVRMYAS